MILIFKSSRSNCSRRPTLRWANRLLSCHCKAFMTILSNPWHVSNTSVFFGTHPLQMNGRHKPPKKENQQRTMKSGFSMEYWFAAVPVESLNQPFGHPSNRSLVPDICTDPRISHPPAHGQRVSAKWLVDGGHIVGNAKSILGD